MHGIMPPADVTLQGRTWSAKGVIEQGLHVVCLNSKNLGRHVILAMTPSRALDSVWQEAGVEHDINDNH